MFKGMRKFAFAVAAATAIFVIPIVGFFPIYLRLDRGASE